MDKFVISDIANYTADDFANVKQERFDARIAKLVLREGGFALQVIKNRFSGIEDFGCNWLNNNFPQLPWYVYGYRLKSYDFLSLWNTKNILKSPVVQAWQEFAAGHGYPDTMEKPCVMVFKHFELGDMCITQALPSMHPMLDNISHMVIPGFCILLFSDFMSCKEFRLTDG